MSVQRPEPSYFVPTVPAVQRESMCGDIYSVVLLSQDRAGCLGSVYMNYFFFYFCEEYNWNFIRNSIEFVEKVLLHWSCVLPTSRAFTLLFQVSLPVLGLLQGIFTSYFTGQLYMRLSSWFLLYHFLLLDKKATNCCILILYSATLLKLLVFTKDWKARTYKIMLHVNTL